jgi:molecular chaperone HscA
LLADLQQVREGSDHHAIDAAVEALAHGTEAFAAERMNRGIRQALSGKRVEEV